MKPKTRTYFRDLDVPEGGVECKYLTVTSIDTLLVYGNKYDLKVYLDNSAYKNIDI